MSFLRRSWSAALLFALAGPGCNDEPELGKNEQELRYQLCGQDITKTELVRFLDGNLVVLAAQTENGVSAGQIAAGLVVALVLNGIDFSNLAYEPSFSDGHYTFSNGDTSLGVRLFFTQAFGAQAAGDIVPYNVFDISSYVQNLQVTSFDPQSGTYSYDYDPGPLHDLIEGEIAVDGDNPLDFSIRVKIRADLLAFEADSQQTYSGRPPRVDDELRVVMTTTRAPLLEVYDQFLAGGYGFRYTGTEYRSVYFGIEQELTDSLFLMRTDERGGWFWEGDYESDVHKSDQTMFQRGFVSNLEENYTEYYCDEARSQRAGVARHRLDLLGGVFVFEDGTSVPYGLEPF